MDRKTTNAHTAAAAAAAGTGQPNAWINSQLRFQGMGVMPLTDPDKAPAGTLYAGGTSTVDVPRGLVVGVIVAAVLGALFLGFVLGAVGAEHEPTKGGTASVSYSAPSNLQDSQHGPVRAPNQAEASAYGVALESAYGTCSLEWHGDNGGWWEPVCEGPKSH